MTPHPMLTITDEVADALATGAARWSRWRARSSATACPTRSNVEMAREVEGIVRDARRGAGDDRGARTAARGSGCRPTTSSCSPATTTSQGQHPRPALRRRPRPATARRPSPRRCGSRRWPGSGCSSPAGSAACTAAPADVVRRRADLTELVHHRGRRRLRRREEHPRHRPHPRDAGDPRRAGARRTARDEFPSFYSRSSGLRAPRCASTARTRSPR